MTKHKWFFDVLRQMIEHNNLSINEFSKLTSISYVSLHRMLSGDQNITEKDYKKIIDSGVFSDAQLDILDEMNSKFNIDKSERLSIDYVMKMLNKLEELSQDTSYEISVYSSEEPTNQVLHSYDRIKRYITYNITKLVNTKKSLVKARFFILADETLINDIFHALNNLSRTIGPDKLDVEFLFLFDSSNKFDSKEQTLKKFASFIKLIGLSDFVRLKYISIQGANQFEKMSIYPYYIILDEEVIQFDKNLSHALVLNDVKDASKIFLDAYEALENKKNLLLKYDARELNDYIMGLVRSPKYLQSHNYTLRYSFSTMNITTKMFSDRMAYTFKKLAVKNFSTRDLRLIKDYKERLDKEEEKIKTDGLVTQFILETGIKDFLETGVLSDYLEIGGIFSEHDRARIALEALKNIKRGYKLRLISQENSDKYALDQFTRAFEIYFDCNEVMIARNLSVEEANIPPDRTVRLSGDAIKYASVVDLPEITSSFELYYNRFLKQISSDPKDTFYKIQEIVLENFEATDNKNINDILAIIENITY
ncbi:hypothetical protein EZV73_07920 [Acidaminobacter sp. JC074]|uniref:hypothetical protein n=1 Tax=Acidaminobacter sp. JC074 TaxID=2530199 RepID=UPI001F103A1E|nr:hypothetical protein [Acidaminobacter sp. JC074]MCH4887494.1 hypothetical protein [Acidaminobacter sp. JC074]